MTVYDNMAFPLQARKMPRKEMQPLIEQVAHSLGIAHLLHQRPRQLSGGQMQRVALGRAIVRHPHVFLLDEPLSNLDAMLRVETRAELKRLQRNLGVTTIYVTHDQEEAMTLADTLVVMNNGRAEQIGTPETVYQHPRTVFVARFIGSPGMNLLPCRYDQTTRTLTAEQFQIVPPARYHAALHRIGEQFDLLLGVRPEACALITDHQSEGNAIPAHIYMREPLGRETLLTLSVGDEYVKVIEPPHVERELNSQVWLTFAEEALHIFDTEHGAALID
jgi:ABC-type sugar transport system ATPase subunit